MVILQKKFHRLIPEEERELPILDNAAEEMKHNLLLKFSTNNLIDF